MTTHEYTADILVVDDTPANLRLLSDMLKDSGYKARPVPNGKLALKAAETSPPDLCLLDITMPEMSGYEVCEQLKANPALNDIPVIFISALTETIDKVRAFKSGGVDYLTKPFEFEEVRARVETHLEIRRLQKELEIHNRHLDDLVKQRTHELREAHERLALLDKTKDEFLKVISHELRTPLNGVLGISDLIAQHCPNDAETDKLMNLFEASRVRLLGFLDDALLLPRIENAGDEITLSRVSLSTILEASLKDARDALKIAALAPGIDPTTSPWDVVGEEQLLTKAMSTLLQTAAKLAGSTGSTRLSTRNDGERAVVTIEIDGCALPDAALKDFFDASSTVRSQSSAEELGLAPVVAERIVALCGGSVSLWSRAPQTVDIEVQLSLEKLQR